MRHIQDKYDAVMKQISIFFSKYEVLSTAIFKHSQNIIKLLLLSFKYTVAKQYHIIAVNVHGTYVEPKIIEDLSTLSIDKHSSEQFKINMMQ